MLTLWGRRNAINVQKVMWLIEELAISYEHIEAGAPRLSTMRHDSL